MLDALCAYRFGGFRSPRRVLGDKTPDFQLNAFLNNAAGQFAANQPQCEERRCGNERHADSPFEVSTSEQPAERCCRESDQRQSDCELFGH